MKKTADKKAARVLVDCGTSYAKIYYADTHRKAIVPSRSVLRHPEKYNIIASTGHVRFKSSKRQVNELVALAEGALAMIDDRDFTILDCGARDVKYVKVKNRRISGMDWNTECGAFTGQVIELLEKYFDLNPNALPKPDDRLSVVCGVLGMTAMFDLISQGISHEEAFAQFLGGVAFNCETLVGRPDRLYLSGGLCNNQGFIDSFTSETIPLGRFVLIEGLKKMSRIK